MKCTTINDFKTRLRKAIETQSMEKFTSILRGLCPFPTLYGYDWDSNSYCPGCGLSDINGPKALIGSAATCIGGSISDIYNSYCRNAIDEKTALAKLVFEGIKLLAYLDNKE